MNGSQVPRARLIVVFWGVPCLLAVYAALLWMGWDAAAPEALKVFPVAVGSILAVRGAVLMVRIAPALFGKSGSAGNQPSS